MVFPPYDDDEAKRRARNVGDAAWDATTGGAVAEVTNGRDFERRLQSIAQALTISILIGYGVAMVDLVKSVARLEVIKEQVARDLHEMKSEVSALRMQVSNATVAAASAATAAAAAAAAAQNVPTKR